MLIIPILGDEIDERDVARWDLLAVALTIAAVKLVMLAYYRLVD